MASSAQSNAYSYIDVNNVKGLILDNGTSFNPRLPSDFIPWEVPKGSGLSPLFQQSLWIGGIAQSDNSLHLAGQKYAQNGFDFWSGPLRLADATTIPEVVAEFSHVWNVTKAEIDDFIAHHNDAGYVVPDDILSWPAHGDAGYAENLAPFVDMNGDGRYNPADGDYPDILGDQCLFLIYNDSYADHEEFGGAKLGLEVHAMVYAFSAPDDEALNNTVFFRYKLINRSSETYRDVYVGVMNDWDIGYGWDDFVGCDVKRGICYGYNGNEIDQNYGDNAPVQVTAFIAGPYMDPDGLDNPAYSECGETPYYSGNLYGNGVHFGNGIVDDERLGMSCFLVFGNSSSATGDPRDAEQAYYNLRGMWRDGTVMCYGGNGYPGNAGTVGPRCRFMFPNDSDPCNIGTDGLAPNDGFNTNDNYWTEEQAGNAPNDRRGLAVTGPFTFQPGAEQPLDYAMITVWKDDRLSALEKIGRVVDHVNAKYAAYQTAVSEKPVGTSSNLRAYPNPTNGTFVVEGTGRLTIVNLLGQVVMTREIAESTSLTLPQGMYFLTLDDGNILTTQKIVVR